MKNQPHILIVDDDPEICELLKSYLEQHGYRISIAEDGRQMDKRMQAASIDLVVLDIMLPNEDGISLCKRLRETSNVMIIMLSAAGEETDRIVGLEVGADDYLTKPFNPRELLARIKALMRRTTGKLASSRKKLASLPNLHFANWTFDRNRRYLVAADGTTVPLSSSEFELLIAFVENPKRTLTRDQLLDLTRGKESGPFDRSIDVQVARLRKKIEKDPKTPQIILTVRGGGYQFNTEVSEA